MAATPTIVIGRNNWGIKLSNLLGYYQSDDGFFVKREFSATRASLATRVNSSGFIEVPRTNLALQSENFGTTWAQTNLLAFGSGSVLNTTGTLDPFGGNSADLIVANTTPAVQHRVDQVTASASGSYTFSVFVKAAGYNFCRLRIGNTGGDFNLNTGAITVTDTGIVTSIRSFGNGWYRCIISKAASIANETVRINMQPASNTGDFAGDGISGIYIYGAQYEPTANVTDYIPTTTSAVTIFGGLTVNAANANNIPRIDYTGGSPALLVEPSGTNGILNSEDTATSWGAGANLSSGYVDVIGVSGNNLTVAVSGSNIGVSAGRLQRSSNNVALASGSTYTISFLMKKTGTHTIGGYYANITGAALGNLGAGFDVSGSFSSGVLYDTAGTANRIRRVEQWGTEVYRCSETFTMTASGTLASLNFAPLSGVTSQFNPAVGLGIAFAAPQIELGAVPTSFIPTTTAAVSRSADVVTLSGATDYIGQTEGTIYVEAFIPKISSAFVIGISDGLALTQSVYLQVQTNLNLDVLIRSGGTTVGPSIAAANWSAGLNKVAFTYGAGSCSVVLNGGSPVTAIVTNVPTCNRITLGSRVDVPGTLSLTDRIRSAAIYNTRLSNAELTSLTTL
jgi:hypothetical protein